MTGAPSRQAIAEAAGLLRHVPLSEVPSSEDILSGAALERRLALSREPPYSLVAMGDVMLGGRARKAMKREGPAWPLAGIRPLLRHARIRLANLEGPLSTGGRRQERSFAYRVDPAAATLLAEAGFDVLNLANNHLTDCGRRGVQETLQALESAGIRAIGAGAEVRAAHRPAIVSAQGLKVGLLGYYWNRRTAATEDKPGSAMDPPPALLADIGALRPQVDRVVVTFHWGVPYEREPSPADRAKARLAVELGADLVVGHHPHVAQAFEIYRGRPIFYSVGNAAFGSGNSKAEGLLLGVRFEASRTLVDVFPLYVKNRDPRVDYQSKALKGEAAAWVLLRLAKLSGEHGRALTVEDGIGRLLLPREGGGG